MIVIRPTATLAKRMKVKLQPTQCTSDAKLGDWYAVDFVLHRKQFILCVSSASRLAVVMDSAPYAKFPNRLCDAVTEVLGAIGVSEPVIQQEQFAMSEFTLAKTESRSILGTANEYRSQLDYLNDYGRVNSTLEMSLWLSNTISLVLPDGFPTDSALKLFGQTPPDRRQKSLDIEMSLARVKPKLYLLK